MATFEITISNKTKGGLVAHERFEISRELAQEFITKMEAMIADLPGCHRVTRTITERGAVAVVRLAHLREIAWPGQPCSVPYNALNQSSFRQLAERRGQERNVLKLPGAKNDHAKEEETKKSSPGTTGDSLAPASGETTPPGAPHAARRAEAGSPAPPAGPGR